MSQTKAEVCGHEYYVCDWGTSWRCELPKGHEGPHRSVDEHTQGEATIGPVAVVGDDFAEYKYRVVTTWERIEI